MTVTLDAPTTPTPAPHRSLEQRRKALDKGNYHRSFRAEFKRAAKAGRADVCAVLLDPPAEMATIKVFDLLMAMPKVGRVKVNRVFTACRMSPAKTIGGLSERQRGELVWMLKRGRAR